MFHLFVVYTLTNKIIGKSLIVFLKLSNICIMVVKYVIKEKQKNEIISQIVLLLFVLDSR